MAQITITINNRVYEVACDDGQEDHLARLGTYIDSKVTELSNSIGQVGDARLLVMASLLIADELADVYGELAEAREALEAAQTQAPAAPAGTGDADEMARNLELLAGRVEEIAARLESA
ncbi:MAG: cell division protein ZapA [Alphaproteobacteria bacterium]